MEPRRSGHGAPFFRVGQKAVQRLAQFRGIGSVHCEAVDAGLDEFDRPASLAQDHGSFAHHGIGDGDAEPFEIAPVIDLDLGVEEDIGLSIELRDPVGRHEPRSLHPIFQPVLADELLDPFQRGAAPADDVAEGMAPVAQLGEHLDTGSDILARLHPAKREDQRRIVGRGVSCAMFRTVAQPVPRNDRLRNIIAQAFPQAAGAVAAHSRDGSCPPGDKPHQPYDALAAIHELASMEGRDIGQTHHHRQHGRSPCRAMHQIGQPMLRAFPAHGPAQQKWHEGRFGPADIDQHDGPDLHPTRALCRLGKHGDLGASVRVGFRHAARIGLHAAFLGGIALGHDPDPPVFEPGRDDAVISGNCAFLP